MDLTELQKNMKHYNLERVLDFPLFYVDLQKMFSLRYDDGHMKRNLTSAVEYLNIQEEHEFHRALSDAYYTARILQSMDYDKYKDRLSIDTFYSPRITENPILFPDYNVSYSSAIQSNPLTHFIPLELKKKKYSLDLMNILNLLPVSF